MVRAVNMMSSFIRTIKLMAGKFSPKMISHHSKTPKKNQTTIKSPIHLIPLKSISPEPIKNNHQAQFRLILQMSLCKKILQSSPPL
jgi:hypothetical protein